METTINEPARKPRSDAGIPRGPRLPPGARAEAILADARGRADARIRAQADRVLGRAHLLIMEAAALISSVDKDKAAAITELGEMVDGLELGGEA